MLGAVQIQNEISLDVLDVCFLACTSVVIQVRNLRGTGRRNNCEGDFCGLKTHRIAVLFLLVLLTCSIQDLL